MGKEKLRIAGISADIRTKYLPNSNLNCYYYANLLGLSSREHGTQFYEDNFLTT
jgi:hypothetical protein